MSGFGDRVLKRREELGLSQPELGRASGLSYQAVQQIEAGTTKSTRRLLELATALKTTPEWLMHGHGAADVYTPPVPITPKMQRDLETSPAPSNVYSADGWPRDLPVMGTAECGPDGWALFNGEVIRMAPRPPELAGIPKAYAVYVRGSSMENRYFDGEIVYVNPAKPVQQGDFVLVQLVAAQDGEPPRALIKRLVRRSGSKVILEQFSPKKIIEVKTSEIISIHKIVLSGEG